MSSTSPPRSRYQTVRRVVAPLAVVAAILLLFHESCREEANAEVRFAVDFGDQAGDVRAVRADVWSGDDSIGFFEERFGEGGATRRARWQQRVPREDVEVSVNVTLASGEVYEVRRKVRASGGAEVVIDARR